MPKLKKNIEKGFWSNGIFHPIRASEDYDPDRAGDNDDVFDQAIRRRRNRRNQEKNLQQQIENQLREDIYGSDPQQKVSLSKFVRAQGGIYDKEAIERVGWKAIDKKGIAFPNAKHSIDTMRESAIESGYYPDYEAASDLVSDLEADVRGSKMYPIYTTNPKRRMKRNPTTIAKEIFRQLGANKFKAMTGAKFITGHKDGLSFKLPARFAADGINYIRITLTPKDLYDVSFHKLWGSKNTVIKKYRDIFATDLVKIIETTTGLSLSLGTMGTAKKNPHFHPVQFLIMALNAAVSAFTLKRLVEEDKRKTKPASATRRKKNPHLAGWRTRNESGSVQHLLYGADCKLKAIIEKSKKDSKYIVEFPRDSIEFKQMSLKDAKRYAERYTRKKRNPKKNPIRSKAYERFNGRKPTKATEMRVSHFAPKRLAQLGDLIEIKLTDGSVLDFQSKAKSNPFPFRLCTGTRSKRLWIAGRRIAKVNPALPKSKMNVIGKIDHVIYGAKKPHHGDFEYTHYIHELGEETGEKPYLCADKLGYPVIVDGAYKIEARGIVN